jgi:hypothetical protein
MTLGLLLTLVMMLLVLCEVDGSRWRRVAARARSVRSPALRRPGTR